MTRTVTFACAVLLAVPLFAADVIITEIMYNPDSVEGRTSGDDPQPCRTEWVELYNAGSQEVDLSGWTLADEDGATGAIADGTSIAPGEAVVLIAAECGVATFQQAWGEGFQVIELTGWSKGGLAQLANSPSDINEILRVNDADGATVDQVNYDDEGDWPADEPDGPSIYLKPDMLNAEANDAGSSWARSADGTDEAKVNETTDVFTGKDAGSPGKVAKAE